MGPKTPSGREGRRDSNCLQGLSPPLGRQGHLQVGGSARCFIRGASPHYRSLPGLGRRKEDPCYTFEYASDDQASSPGPSPRSDRGLGCPCLAAPAAVPTRPAYKVKGEVPEGLLRRRAQEETEREAVVKVSYTRKEARRLRRESPPVVSLSAWSLRCPDWNRHLECHWYRRPKA
mgnify:CR=1 FL=1